VGAEVSLRRRVPLLKIRHHYSPSSDLADVAIGEVFNHVDGKRFMLIDRDPWQAVVIRYTRFDSFAYCLGVWFRSKLLTLKKR
jgi:hypothetical protein